MISSAPFKAIFFDNDGLLVDTESVWLKACRQILAPFGIEITDEWYITEVLGKGSSAIADPAQAKGMSDEQISELRKSRNELYTSMLREHVQILDGVKETLEKLKGKFLMGIVTSSRREDIDVILYKTGLRDFFSFIITSDDVEKIKPNPEPYLKAIELSGMEKEECLVLEDSLRGVRAAKAAGIACYAIPEAWTSGHDFSIADKILGNMRELEGLIF